MQILVKTFRWASLVSLPLLWLTIPDPAMARIGIGSCADSLIADGVNESAAAAACSDALEPRVLASCVADISSDPSIEGDAALEACYRVRRPDELASCVTTISSSLETESMMALDTCRRSLLPVRHAECTLELAGISEISSEEAMQSCITAEFKPGEVDPTTAN